jgi:type IV pilus assembly protein PilC
MIYPAAVALFAAAVVAVIVWQVIPAFASLFTGLDASLPLPTQMVIAVSSRTVQLAPYLSGIGILLVYGVRRYQATEAGQFAIDRILLSLPMVGPVLRKIAVARFCRTLSTLIASGVPILDGLEITARTSGNSVIERAVRNARRSIEGGATVSGPLARTGVFPGMVVQMIGVGEATGALDAMLAKIADFFEEDVDRSVGSLLSMLEPAMIAFLGIVVGGIVISMYLPIFELISELAG